MTRVPNCCKAIIPALALLFPVHPAALAWVYPEHREIALLAILRLDPQRKAVLDQLWAQARIGFESRLCVVPADATQGVDPDCLDYASWPAISGDHSCSGSDLLNVVLHADWILDVAAVAAELNANLSKATERYERINHLRSSDIQLQRADPEYATRAGSNNVHFLRQRPAVDTDGHDYVLDCLHEGIELNGLGAYAWYHFSAMVKARQYSRRNLSTEERSALALAILADEAFAIHFLEDAFAAGHVAGTWGDASVRKGTHDYYNEYGLAVNTWDKHSIILMGDAYMRVEDAERASAAISISIEQIMDAVSGEGIPAQFIGEGEFQTMPDTFNVCSANIMPKFGRLAPGDAEVVKPLITETLKGTPIPGLGKGAGELPRFKSELGPFIGVAPSARAMTIDGGFGAGQTNVGATGGLEFAARFGMGLDGVMNEAGDGLVFLELGIRQDGHSTNSFIDSDVATEFGAFGAAIPGRPAFTARLRLPFWLLPGDMLILGPIMLLVSPETLTQMAVQSGNGGLIPWQLGMATSLGRFQFILGREVGVSFFGYFREEDPRIIVPIQDVSTGNETLVGLRSIWLDFPILEYRPFRTFSLTQSSSVAFQLNAGVDIPTDASVILPEGAQAPDLRTVWHIGFRMVFDWRYYY